MSILRHHTSHRRAASILWHRLIFGGALSSEDSHERRPHFFHGSHPERPNALNQPSEIVLLFRSELPEERCDDNIPRPGQINMHHDGGGFWQATIFEGESIEFIGFEKPAQAAGDLPPIGWFLRTLVARRVGSPIRAGRQPGGTEPMPSAPSNLRQAFYLLTGR